MPNDTPGASLRQDTSNTILFPGFDLPEQNWCKMPLALVENMGLISSLAEMKVIFYILRHTWGYKEYEDTKPITMDEFEHGRKRKNGTRIDNGTGLSHNAIKSGLVTAEKHGFITVEVNDKDKARIKKSYQLTMSQVSQGVKSCPPEGQELPPGLPTSAPRSEIDTLDRNSSNGANKSRKRRPAAEINPIKDAIVAAFGWNVDGMTKGEWGKVQAAARDLYDAGRRAEDVPALYAYCQKHRTDFGPNALCNVVSEVTKQQAKTKILAMPDEVPLPEPSDFYNIAGVVS